MKRQRISLVAALIVALGAAAVACGGDGSDTKAPNGADTTSSWLELLAHVPNTPDTRIWVEMNDYQKARRIFGMELPDENAGPQDLDTYTVHLMSGGGPYGSQRMSELQPAIDNDWLQFPDSLKRELSFTFADLDQDISAGLPGRSPLILRGRFDGDTIVSDSEISTDGRLLLAKLYITEHGFPIRLLLPWEPLLLYDDTAD